MCAAIAGLEYCVTASYRNVVKNRIPQSNP